MALLTGLVVSLCDEREECRILEKLWTGESITAEEEDFLSRVALKPPDLLT
jgi:hypothetical protein